MKLRKRKKEKLKYSYISNENENKTVYTIWNMIVYAFLYLSFGIEYIKFVPLSKTYEMIIILIGFICILLSALTTNSEKLKKYSNQFPLIGIVICLIIFNPKNLYGGFLGTINYEISRWNLEYDDGRALFQSNLITENSISHFAVLVAFVIAYFVFILVKNKKGIPIILMITLFFVPSLIVGEFDGVAFSLAIIGYAASVMAKSKTADLRRRIIWSVVTAIILLAIALSIGNSQSQYITKLREEQKQILSDIRFGKDTLPQGDLSKADKLLSDDKERLEIKSTLAKDTYFKGFVGAKYENGKWTPLANSSYGGENNGMLTWLSNNNFSPVFEYSSYNKCDKSNNKANDVSIKNIGAKRNYIYVPYSTETFNLKNVYQNKDNNLKSAALFGQKDYSFSEKSTGKPSEILTLSSWYSSPENSEQEQYVKAEKIYRNFVYNNYLTVDADLWSTVDKVFWQDADNNDEQSILSATQRIREVLNDTAKYKEIPKSIPEGAEPIKWFLTDGKEGNSVLFASAAVEAYRAAGFPARYVEGYYSFNADGKNETVTLTSQNAHAWVDVYMDGIGWLPIDVTPGFYYDTYSLIELVAKPKQIDKTDKDKKNSPDKLKLNEDSGSGAGSKTKKEQNIKLTIIGIITLILICAIWAIAISYLLKINKVIKVKKAIENPDSEKRQKQLYAVVMMLLQADKIDFTLGKDAETAAKKICALHPEFEADEFLRVNNILEKLVFGEMKLEEFEERTLIAFIEKYSRVRKINPFRIRRK